jgi:hypothetical protein
MSLCAADNTSLRIQGMQVAVQRLRIIVKVLKGLVRHHISHTVILTKEVGLSLC